MTDHLGPRSRSIYAHLRDHYVSEGVPPTVRELARLDHCNVSTVMHHLYTLERAGWIRRSNLNSRCWLPIRDKVVISVEQDLVEVSEEDISAALSPFLPRVVPDPGEEPV